MPTAAAATPQLRPATHVIYAAAASRDQGEPTGGWHEAGVARAQADGRFLVFIDSRPIPDHYAGYIQLCPLGTRPTPFTIDDFDDVTDFGDLSTRADTAPITRPPTHTPFIPPPRHATTSNQAGAGKNPARPEEKTMAASWLTSQPGPSPTNIAPTFTCPRSAPNHPRSTSMIFPISRTANVNFDLEARRRAIGPTRSRGYIAIFPASCGPGDTGGRAP
jgi:hypothetical protein